MSGSPAGEGGSAPVAPGAGTAASPRTPAPASRPAAPRQSSSRRLRVLHALRRQESLKTEEEPPKKPAPCMESAVRKKDGVFAVKEMMSTEESYFGVLTSFVRAYVACLERLDSPLKREFMNNASVAVLLNNVKELHVLNEKLLQDIRSEVQARERDDDLPGAMIGRIFVRNAPLLKLYALYASNHDRALGVINEFSKKNAFADLLAECSASEECHHKRHSIFTFMIEPVQRVPRYLLLLKAIAKKTSPEHPDYPHLQRALVAVDEAARHINDTVRDRECRDELKGLQRRFTGGVNLIASGRRMLREGTLTKVSRKKHIPYVFMLFTDAVLYAEDGKLGLNLHRAIPLYTSSLADVDPVDSGLGEEAAARAFTLLSTEKSFVVICDSVGDRQAWVTDIERQIGECRQARGMDAPAPAAPVWMPDSNQTKCPLCSRAFTVFFRRHHCRKCGQLCCEACSRTRVIQPNISVSHKVRVCDQCRDRIAEQPPPLVFDANVRGAVELGSLAGGEVNTYCEVLINGSPRGKTETQASTRAPEWEKGHFVFPIADVVSAVITFRVWSWDPSREDNVDRVLGECSLRPSTAPHVPHTPFFLPLREEGAPMKRVAPNSDTLRPSLHLRCYLRPSPPPYAELRDYQWIDHYQSDALRVGTPFMLHCVFRMFADALAAEPLLHAAAAEASKALSDMKDSPTHVVPSKFLRHLCERARSALTADGASRTPRSSVIGSFATASATSLRNSTGRLRHSTSGSSLAGGAALRGANRDGPERGVGDSSAVGVQPTSVGSRGGPGVADGVSGFALAPITEGSDSDDSDRDSDSEGGLSPEDAGESATAAAAGNGHDARSGSGVRWRSQQTPGDSDPAPTELSRRPAPTALSASARVASMELLPESSSEEQRHALLTRLQSFTKDLDGVAEAAQLSLDLENRSSQRQAPTTTATAAAAAATASGNAPPRATERGRSHRSSLVPSASDAGRRSRRHAAVSALVTNESQYVELLGDFVESFVRPLQDVAHGARAVTHGSRRASLDATNSTDVASPAPQGQIRKLRRFFSAPESDTSNSLGGEGGEGGEEGGAGIVRRGGGASGILSSHRRSVAQRLLNTADVSVFLQSVQQLATLNGKLLSDLRHVVSTWQEDTSSVGEVFVEFAPLFRMYTSYTALHGYAKEVLASPELSAFLAECAHHPQARGRRVEQFVMAPVMRMSEYLVMLDDLRRETPETHADYARLGDAIQRVRATNAEVERGVEARQERERLLDVSTRLHGAPLNVLESDLRLVREGEMVKFCRREPKRFSFFLFDRVLMYGTRVGGVVRHNRTLELATLTVDDSVRVGAGGNISADVARAGIALAAAGTGAATATEASQDVLASHLFQVRSLSKSFLVAAASPAERRTWVENIRELVANIHGGSGDPNVAAPVWTSDRMSGECSLCGAPFTVLRRRHHCRKCGALVCDPCSSERQVLAHLGPNPVRVCNTCAKTGFSDKQTNVDTLREQLRASVGASEAARSRVGQ